MVRRESYQYQMKNIPQAKALLVVRAAKRVYYQLGDDSDEGRYLEALQREFEMDHIRFLKPGKAATPQPPVQIEDYLCFDNMLVRTIIRRDISPDDEAEFKEKLAAMRLNMGLIVGISEDGVSVKQVNRSQALRLGDQ